MTTPRIADRTGRKVRVPAGYLRRMAEERATLEALRRGEVDALVMPGGAPGQERIVQLEGADRPYRIFLETMQEGAVTVSFDGLVVFCNRRFARMVRLPQEAVLGSRFASYVPEGDHKRLRDLLRQAPGEEVSGEFELIASDESRLPVQMSANQVEFEPGRLTSCVVVTDLSAQHKRMRELREAHERLLEADRYKDEFLSVISHELRTPLNFISGFASILADGVLGPLTGKQLQAIEKILQGSDRLLDLVDRLLSYAKIQAGKFEIRPREERYTDLVEGAVARLEPLAARKRLALKTEAGYDGMAAIDAGAISQVLENLVANAIKFTPCGGRIVVRTRLAGDWVVTEVEDTGIGIAEADLPRLFKRFQQLDMSNTREAGGVGLGLSIVKAIVEAHGGTVTVRSAPGQGSTFSFTVPAVR